jgi:hypothetical protein
MQNLGNPKFSSCKVPPQPITVREYVVAVIWSDSLLPTASFIQGSSRICTVPGSENQWDSSPGLDILVEEKSETLRYNDDPDFLVDLDRKNKELHSRSLVYDFDTLVEYGHKSLLQNSFLVVLMVFSYVSVKKWRDTRRQMRSTAELLVGPQEFSSNALTSATTGFLSSTFIGHGVFGAIYNIFLASSKLAMISAVNKSQHSHKGKTEFLA